MEVADSSSLDVSSSIVASAWALAIAMVSGIVEAMYEAGGTTTVGPENSSFVAIVEETLRAWLDFVVNEIVSDIG